MTRRAFGLGEQVNGTARFFTTDHLGSVREVTDTAGAPLARYAFDPWGRRTVTAGTDVTTVGFTGHRSHTSAGLALALYRGYNAWLGRWVSEDPIGFGDGPHVFAYVRNRPTTSTDPDGLRTVLCCRLLAGGVGTITRQRHCFVVITENPNVSGGAATGYSLIPDGNVGKTHRNYKADMDTYRNGTAECFGVPTCDPCKEQRIDQTYSDPGPSGNYRRLGPNSNTYARNLLTRGGCVPPPGVANAPGY